jgi:hypothetical protein
MMMVVLILLFDDDDGSVSIDVDIIDDVGDDFGDWHIIIITALLMIIDIIVIYVCY